VPEGGERKHRERIHRESKIVDTHGNLPFNFSKPPKLKKHAWFKCVECNRILSASKNTIMCACPECKKATKVERIEE
jgi:hypothetical protein